MLEADFQRYYGIDLGRALFGDRPMPWPRLRALIEHLPDDSALARTFGDGWTMTERLLMALAGVKRPPTRWTVAAMREQQRPPARPRVAQEWPPRLDMSLTELRGRLRGAG